MDVLRHLENTGVQVAVVAERVRPYPPSTGVIDAVIELTVDDRKSRFAVEERRRVPYAGEIGPLVERAATMNRHGAPLLVAPFITEGTGRRLIAAGWSWADEVG